MNTDHLPALFRRIAGPLPAPGMLAEEDHAPFETLTSAREGFVDQGGVKLWYAVWGERGPWLAFAPPFQIVHAALLKATVPYLAQHFRVVTMDPRGNGRSERPRGQEHYSFDLYVSDFIAVLDAAGCDRVALVGISAAAMTVLRVAAEQPQRVSHVITAGGFADSLHDQPMVAQFVADELTRMQADWPAYVDGFMRTIFSEPHSTKPYEDGVRYGWATSAEVLAWCYRGWLGNDVRALAQHVACPTLVIHGDEDGRVLYARGQAIHELVPGARLLTIGSGGHVTAVRDPVAFNRAVRDFVAGPAPVRTWVRAKARPRRAARCSSAARSGWATCSAIWPSHAHCANCNLTCRSTGSPSIRRRATSSRKASACIRFARGWPTRAGISNAWPASTTCTPSSRCAPWTR